eukprot:COSAG05_NODE_18036_length_315_cov_0.699074_1_plen_40_part_01
MITVGLGGAPLSLANKAHKPARSGICPPPQKDRGWRLVAT